MYSQMKRGFLKQGLGAERKALAPSRDGSSTKSTQAVQSPVAEAGTPVSATGRAPPDEGIYAQMKRGFLKEGLNKRAEADSTAASKRATPRPATVQPVVDTSTYQMHSSFRLVCPEEDKSKGGQPNYRRQVPPPCFCAYSRDGGETDMIMIGTRAELEHIIPFGEVALKKPLPSNGGERPFRVQETEQKGLGMFATRVIKAGELVLAERPTVLSPRDSLGNKYFAPLEPAFYDAALAALSEGARAAFMTLVDRCSLGKRAHPLAGRIMTNGFTAGNLLGEDAEDNPQDVVFAATYLLISRANHDCIPNAHYHWHRARWCGQLHATRDIAAGEEITVKYTTLTTHAERQAFFQKQYSCSCLCRTCLDASPEDVRRSDERREAVVQLLCRLENALDPSAYPLLQDSEERAVRRTLECARREGMMFQYANILHQGSRIMQMQDSPLVAFDWLKEARRAYAMILGEDSIGVVQVDDIGQYLVDRMRARGMQCSWP